MMSWSTSASSSEVMTMMSDSSVIPPDLSLSTSWDSPSSVESVSSSGTRSDSSRHHLVTKAFFTGAGLELKGLVNFQPNDIFNICNGCVEIAKVFVRASRVAFMKSWGHQLQSNTMQVKLTNQRKIMKWGGGQPYSALNTSCQWGGRNKHAKLLVAPGTDSVNSWLLLWYALSRLACSHLNSWYLLPALRGYIEQHTNSEPDVFSIQNIFAKVVWKFEWQWNANMLTICSKLSNFPHCSGRILNSAQN